MFDAGYGSKCLLFAKSSLPCVCDTLLSRSCCNSRLDTRQPRILLVLCSSLSTEPAITNSNSLASNIDINRLSITSWNPRIKLSVCSVTPLSSRHFTILSMYQSVGYPSIVPHWLRPVYGTCGPPNFYGNLTQSKFLESVFFFSLLHLRSGTIRYQGILHHL